MNRFLVILIALLLSTGKPSAEKRIISSLPIRSEAIKDFNYSSFLSRMKEMPLHRIEGLWQFPSTGVEVAIIRTDETMSYSSSEGTTVYSMILTASPNRAIRQGTVMGLITPAAKKGEYDANIYTSNIASTLTIPKRFTLSLTDDDSSLQFRQHRSKFSVNLWRLLPYLWRYTIHPNAPEKNSDGCIRIYPAPALPREPIYL